MEKLKPFIWILLFGSLWGLSEVVGGEALYNADVPFASVWLSAWALFLLSVARTQQNTAGTSTAIGAIAALFRLVNAGPFICHLLGIFMLGLAFDIAATFLLNKKTKGYVRQALAGILGAYGGYALFALVITYIVRYETWVAGGWPKVAKHIFVGGSLAALAAVLVVPLGLMAGRSKGLLKTFSSRWAYTSAIALTVILWIVGQFAV